MRRPHRLCALFAAAVICLTMLQPAAASYSSVHELPSEASFDLGILTPDNWEAGFGVLNIGTRVSEGKKSLLVTAEADPFAVTHRFQTPLNLSAFYELGMAVSAAGTSDCTVTLTMYSGESVQSESCSIRAGITNYIYFLLPDSIKSSLDALEITVTGASSLLISSAFADSCMTCIYGGRFSCRGFETVTGRTEAEDERIVLYPESGTASIDVLTILHSDMKTAFTVELDSSFTGILTVEDTFAESILQTALYTGRCKYTFVLSGSPEKFRLSVSGTETAGDAAATIYSMSFTELAEKKQEHPGTVTSCLYDTKNIKLKGTLTSEAAVEYIDARLALFEVPVWLPPESALTGEPLSEMSVSTRFELSAPISSVSSAVKFVAAIIDGDNIIPVAPPVFAGSASDAAVSAQECLAGIYGVDGAAVFDTGANAVIIDVLASELMRVTDIYSSQRFTYKNVFYFFNSRYVDELTASIRFSAAAGCRVYLRLLSDTDSFGFSVSDAGGASRLAAVAAFAAQQFQEASGFIALSGYSRGDREHAENASALLGVFASAVRSIKGNAEIIYDAGTDSQYAAMLSYYNKKNGITGCGVLYTCTGDININGLRSVTDSAAVCGAAAKKSMILWSPGEEPAPSGFAAQYEKVSAAGISALILSAANTSANELPHLSGTWSSIFDLSFSSLSASAVRGISPLWNFADSYSTFGWLSGGGFSSPATSLSEGGTRVLKTELSPGSDKGVLVCWLDTPVNASAADGMRIKLRLSAESSGTAQLSAVLGSGLVRAEYSGDVTYNEDTEIYLSFSGNSAVTQLELSALMINSEVPVTLEITDIMLYSRTLADSELAAKLAPPDVSPRQLPAIYITVIAVLAMTVVIFAVLARKKTHNN